MRRSGQVIGAPLTTARRRSVILRSDGCELRFTFWTAASRVRSAQKLAPIAAEAEPRNPRRPMAECGFMPPILVPRGAPRDILIPYIHLKTAKEIPRESRRIHRLIGAAFA